MGRLHTPAQDPSTGGTNAGESGLSPARKTWWLNEGLSENKLRKGEGPGFSLSTKTENDQVLWKAPESCHVHAGQCDFDKLVSGVRGHISSFREEWGTRRTTVNEDLPFPHLYFWKQRWCLQSAPRKGFMEGAVHTVRCASVGSEVWGARLPHLPEREARPPS